MFRALALAALAGCSSMAPGGDDASAPDLAVAVDAAVAPPDQAGAADDAAVDLATPPDLRSCADGAVENCTNGVDDDCNGKTDCEDPACAAFACVTPPDGTWSIVAYEEGASAPCPPGYAGARTLYPPEVSAAQPAQCGCTCPTTTPASCGGNLLLHDHGSGCPGASDIITAFPIADGACSVGKYTFTNGYGYSITANAVTTQATCGAPTPTVTKQPVPSPPIVSCGAAATGAGCGGGACAPKASGNFKVCLAHAGDVTCPQGTTTRYARFETYADARGCAGSCTCASTLACSVAAGAFYGAAGCAGSVYNVSPACSTSGQVVPFTIASYQAHMSSLGSPACQVTANMRTPTGGVTPEQPITVCCP